MSRKDLAWAQNLALEEGPSFGLDYARYLPPETEIERIRRLTDREDQQRRADARLTRAPRRA